MCPLCDVLKRLSEYALRNHLPAARRRGAHNSCERPVQTDRITQGVTEVAAALMHLRNTNQHAVCYAEHVRMSSACATTPIWASPYAATIYWGYACIAHLSGDIVSAEEAPSGVQRAQALSLRKHTTYSAATW
jgi:hypothetical protein